MPLVTVWNLGTFCSVEPTNLARALRDACLNISELGLQNPEQVTVCFAGDSVLYEKKEDGGRVDPVVVIVELLFDKPERTPEIRKRLARALGETIQTVFRAVGQRRCIEVAIKRFNPERDALWSGGTTLATDR